jgi:hypothetical protein
VTPQEKKAVRYVANAREIDESTLVRMMPIEAIVDEYQRLKGAFAEVTGEAA